MGPGWAAHWLSSTSATRRSRGPADSGVWWPGREEDVLQGAALLLVLGGAGREKGAAERPVFKSRPCRPPAQACGRVPEASRSSPRARARMGLRPESLEGRRRLVTSGLRLHVLLSLSSNCRAPLQQRPRARPASAGTVASPCLGWHPRPLFQAQAALQAWVQAGFPEQTRDSQDVQRVAPASWAPRTWMVSVLHRYSGRPRALDADVGRARRSLLGGPVVGALWGGAGSQGRPVGWVRTSPRRRPAPGGP